MSSPEVGNITPQSERNYASDYWEVALGTHNIWGYIGEARPLYMKMNELWQEVLCNVTKIDFTQDITVSIWMNMNEHIRVCFLLWPHQIYISIGEKLADFQQIGGGEQASDFKFPSESSRAKIWVTFLC